MDWTRKIREHNRVALAKVGSPSDQTLCGVCGGLRERYVVERIVFCARLIYKPQAITLVESELPEHQRDARQLVSHISEILIREAPSFRVGISGPPGVGKVTNSLFLFDSGIYLKPQSTFIEALGMHIIAKGHRVAVLVFINHTMLSK